ncbi:MAG: ankyrin repeat domain-containing protein [Lachnospiraceae bacterium]|nr:ankyrin repeat domain-containing protein [Lachnospiraceae bacterium]
MINYILTFLVVVAILLVVTVFWSLLMGILMQYMEKLKVHRITQRIMKVMLNAMYASIVTIALLFGIFFVFLLGAHFKFVWNLKIACQEGYVKQVEKYLAKEEDINQKYKDNPLINITLSGEGRPEKKLTIVKLLIEKGADVNAVAEDGTTAAMTVVENNCDQIKMLELLEKNGADFTMKDKKGKTLFERARGEDGYEDEECLEYLERKEKEMKDHRFAKKVRNRW